MIDSAEVSRHDRSMWETVDPEGRRTAADWDEARIVGADPGSLVERL